MYAYLLRRILLIPVTLLAIMLVNFVVMQFTPGGPVDQMVHRIEMARAGGAGGTGGGLTEVASGGGGGRLMRGSRGLDPEYLAFLNKSFGFDEPAHVRFIKMMKNYLVLDFGESYFQNRPVLDIVKDKLPVSITLGLWSTLIIYLVSIPLGIRKAIRHGSAFDAWTSFIITICHAIPAFLFGVFLIVLFAGGRYWEFFPLRGLSSPNADTFSLWGRIKDYIWHATLPVASLVVGGFTYLTLLTKNSFLEDLGKQYVVTARAKGLTENRILYGHVFQNAMLIVISSFPSTLVGILFTGSLLIEQIFSLDGIGLLSYQAIVGRDYPIVLATLYVFSIIGLVLNLLSDLIYHLVDPRIDFESREV
ncbi:MAG: microcin ABC transporter permease [Bdellovibrio sp.]|nr:MAG: microcin ABC transporter permease [Bdellovibrio sp.]